METEKQPKDELRHFLRHARKNLSKPRLFDEWARGLTVKFPHLRISSFLVKPGQRALKLEITKYPHAEFVVDEYVYALALTDTVVVRFTSGYSQIVKDRYGEIDKEPVMRGIA